MRLYTVALMLAMVLPLGSVVNAQEAPAEAPAASSNLFCTDNFALTNIALTVTGTATMGVPQTSIEFSGGLKNQNNITVPVAELRARVFQIREDQTFRFIDTYVVEENIVLPAQGEYSFADKWLVPENQVTGEYAIEYAISFMGETAIVLGYSPRFTIVSESQVVQLDHNTMQINGQPYQNFDQSTLTDDQSVDISITVINPTDEDKTIPMQWNQYRGPYPTEESRLDTKTSLLTIAANSEEVITYTTKPTSDKEFLVNAIIDDRGAKSLQDFQFLRATPDPRMIVAGVRDIPLSANQPVDLFYCVATPATAELTPYRLVLEVTDGTGLVVASLDRDSISDASVPSLTPSSNLNDIEIISTIERDGVPVSQETVEYNCAILGGACHQESSEDITLFERIISNSLFLYGGAALLLVLLTLVLIAHRREQIVRYNIKASDSAGPLLLLLFLLGASVLPFSVVNAHPINIGGPSVPPLEPPEFQDICGADQGASSIVLAVNGWSCATAGWTSDIRTPLPVINPPFTWFSGFPHPNECVELSGGNMSARYQASCPATPSQPSQPSQPPQQPPTGSNPLCDPNQNNPIVELGNGPTCLEMGYDIDAGAPVGASGPFDWQARSPEGMCLMVSNGMMINQWATTCSGVLDPPPLPSVDLTINGSDGPLTVNDTDTLNLLWTTTDASSCSLYGAGLSGGGVSLTGNTQIPASAVTNSPETYILNCNGITDSVVVTVTASNQPPNAPTIVGPVSGDTGITYPFTFTATDPDGDQVQYDVDWNNDGTSEVTSLLVNSGISIVGNRSWLTSGTYTFQVRARDMAGAVSGWTQHTITVTQSAPATALIEVQVGTGAWSANDQTIDPGDTINIRWSSTGADTCVGTNFSTGTGNPTSGTVVATAPGPNSATDFSVSCSGTGGPGNDSIRITTRALPNFNQPNVTYNLSPGYDPVTGIYDSVTVIFQTTNNGGSATKANAEYQVRFDRGTDGYDQTATGNLGLLTVGQTVNRTEVFNNVAFSGNRVEVTVDSGNDVAESNEGDNVRVLDMTIPPPDPNLEITVSRPIVQAGETVTVDWNTSATYPMNCSVFGPGVGPIDFNPSVAGPSGDTLSQPITAKSEFTLRCTEPITNTSFSDTATVEIVGRIEEI